MIDSTNSSTVGPLRICPVCAAPTDGRPFCRRDGTITAAGPFKVGGRYLVEGFLGGGGFALVFDARHFLLGKPVALKVLRDELASDPQQAQRFLREARTASRLEHENIVNLIDFGEDDDAKIIYLVMEKLSGMTLAQAIDQPMSPARAIPILLQLSRALAAAHSAGVVHRDVKPRNIFLVKSSGRDDYVKLCDFGLSRLVSGRDRITATGAVIGSPAYMAPEQLEGDVELDHRVDLYSFGCTAYEMLTGRLPHHATSQVKQIANKLAGLPVPSLQTLIPDAGVPPALDALILRCLAHDPAARPASALELEQLLEGLLPAPVTPAPKMPATLIGTMVGSHRVVRLLGSGGVGSVFLAEHPVLGTRVAIKVLRPEIAVEPTMVDRFIFEARTSSTIGSPHLPRYLDFGNLPNGQPFAVMEYLEGETLRDRLDSRGSMPVAEVVHLMAQVATAMELAHSHNIVHRDLKPENLLLVRDASGQDLVKVLDFGIAKLMGCADSASQTAAGLMLGTPYYCAPEQALGLEVGPSADVYAVGVTAFEMLTGQPPFAGTAISILGAKACQEAPHLGKFRPDLPATVARGIAAMLAREPKARIPTMQALRREFESWTVAQIPAPVADRNPDQPAPDLEHLEHLASAEITAPLRAKQRRHLAASSPSTATPSRSAPTAVALAAAQSAAFADPRATRKGPSLWVMAIAGAATALVASFLLFRKPAEPPRPQGAPAVAVPTVPPAAAASVPATAASQRPAAAPQPASVALPPAPASADPAQPATERKPRPSRDKRGRATRTRTRTEQRPADPSVKATSPPARGTSPLDDGVIVDPFENLPPAQRPGS